MVVSGIQPSIGYESLIGDFQISRANARHFECLAFALGRTDAVELGDTLGYDMSDCTGGSVATRLYILREIILPINSAA